MLPARALYRSVAKAMGSARPDEKLHCGEMRDRHNCQKRFMLGNGQDDPIWALVFRPNSNLDICIMADLHRQRGGGSCSRPLCSSIFRTGTSNFNGHQYAVPIC